jgi:hydroxypyruvate isomerase
MSTDRRTFLTDTAAAAKVPPPFSGIRHAVMGWCFKVPFETLAGYCNEAGIVGVEGVSRKHYPKFADHGLEVSLVGSHGFKKGPNDRTNREMCIDKLKDGINVAAEVGAPSVITFTGMTLDGVSRKQQEDNCIEVWKTVMDHAEKKGISIVLEHLNSRVASHPMKGHPGYFGDDVDHCVELIQRVGSPRMKLLFDVYHVQIMNGDVITRIRQYADVIGHVHTAGNPGRGELHIQPQEINYPAVMRALKKTGYQGYVAHEFIPNLPDHADSLTRAVKLCTV